MKLKKAMSLALALAMTAVMAIPAFADEDPYLTVEITNVKDEEALNLGNRTFQLQHWGFSEQEVEEDGWTYDVYTYTKGGAAEQEDFNPGISYALPKGVELLVKRSDDSEFEHGAVELMAWSDPDGDGIYDQRLAQGCLTDSLIFESSVLPVDAVGPFSAVDDIYSGEIVYANVWRVLEDNELYAIGDGMFDVSEIRLSSSMLTEVFGANTFLQMSVTDWYYEGETQNYFFLLTGENVDPSLLEGSTSVPTAPNAATYVVNNSIGGLNVRTGPGTNYKLAAPSLKKGDTFQVTEIQGQWGKLADGKGWVYLPGAKKVAAPAAPETPANPITMQVNNSKGALNVRTGPGTNYKLAGPALKNGTTIQVVETQGQWGKLANDAGWVYLPGAKTVKG